MKYKMQNRLGKRKDAKWKNSSIPDPRSPIPGPRGGFTLLEVMISLAIVGGLLVTLLYTLNYHLGIADRHEVITVSMGLAKEKLAEMEQTPASGKGFFADPYSAFSYETSVRDSLLAPGVSEIMVIVRSGKEDVTLSELIPKKGWKNPS